MNKIFRKIIAIISILILWYPQFCYADLISEEEVAVTGITYLFEFISVIILIISAISFFSLKATVKNKIINDYDNKKSDTISSEEIEKRKNKLQKKFYVWGMILAIAVLVDLYSTNNHMNSFSEWIFCIPIILFIVSLIVRLNKNRKVSYIIYAVSATLVCLMVVSNRIIINYNYQFQDFQERISRYQYFFKTAYSISTTEDLVDTLIENNKRGIKTTIIYQDVKYTSPEELKQLLKENKEKFSKDHYYVTWNVQYGKILHYVKTIELFYKDNFSKDFVVCQ